MRATYILYHAETFVPFSCMHLFELVLPFYNSEALATCWTTFM